MPDNDLISRAAAIDAVYYKPNCKMAIEVLKEVPAVDAAPVRHGRWEEKMEHLGLVCCSVCHDCYVKKEWIYNKKWGWCPQCGVRMDGGNDDGKTT